VGHQVDFTIADFVADLRAPTPSAAAELVAPDCADLARQVALLQERMGALVEAQLGQSRSLVVAEQRALARLSPRMPLDQKRQRVDDLWQRARAMVEYGTALRRARTRALGIELQALSPLAVLERGFAIVWRTRGRQAVTRTEQVQGGDRLTVQVSNGQFGAVVEGEQHGRRNASSSSGAGQLPLDL
jgi:exodeoxyribonuclease VII large subunit